LKKESEKSHMKHIEKYDPSDTIGLIPSVNNIWKSLYYVYDKLEELEKRIDSILESLRKLEKEFYDYCTLWHIIDNDERGEFRNIWSKDDDE